MQLWLSVLILALLITVAPGSAARGVSFALKDLFGVWNDVGAVKTDRANSKLGIETEFDVAFWESSTGLKVSLRNLISRTDKRTTIHFVLTDESGRYEPQWSNLSLSQDERLWAQFSGKTLTIYLTQMASGAALLFRYEFSLQAGYLMFRYDLSRNNEQVETTTRRLRRIKVVM